MDLIRREDDPDTFEPPQLTERWSRGLGRKQNSLPAWGSAQTSTIQEHFPWDGRALLGLCPLLQETPAPCSVARAPEKLSCAFYFI